MKPDLTNDVNTAVTTLKNGGIIAYPTEAVYALGCDPFAEAAVQRLLNSKQRSIDKGLILIAANWAQVKALTLPIPEKEMRIVQETWPGPYTWVFPASPKAPAWITGNFDTIALRITDHPVAQQLCLQFGAPLVSTSANLTNEAPAKTAGQLSPKLLNQLDFLLDSQVGSLKAPTLIRDALTGKVIRA